MNVTLIRNQNFLQLINLFQDVSNVAGIVLSMCVFSVFELIFIIYLLVKTLVKAMKKVFHKIMKKSVMKVDYSVNPSDIPAV